jgi:hypothetical protein
MEQLSPTQQYKREKSSTLQYVNALMTITYNKQLSKSKKTNDGINLISLAPEIQDYIKEHLANILQYKIRDWIDTLKIKIKWFCANPSNHAIDILIYMININKITPDQLDWDRLSANPFAIRLLESYPARIVWYELARNTSDRAIQLLEAEKEKEKNPVNFHWGNFSGNSNKRAVDLIREKILEENILSYDELRELRETEKIDWDKLSGNSSPEAIKILELRPNDINWGYLSGNTDPNAIKLLKKRIELEKKFPKRLERLRYKEKIDWFKLSRNPAAIHLLKRNLDKIEYDPLSANSKAIKLLEKRILFESKNKKKLLFASNKINWCELSTNPKAINILHANQDKIKWEYFSMNPSIFGIEGTNYKSVSSNKLPLTSAKSVDHRQRTPKSPKPKTPKPLRRTN